MPETQMNPSSKFQSSMHTIQSRFTELEVEAKGRLRKALGAGNGALLGLDERLAKVSREDWSVDGLRKRIDLLRLRAENLRASALKRVSEMPGTAVSAIATSSRGPVQNLARELEKLARKLEPSEVAAAAEQANGKVE